MNTNSKEYAEGVKALANEMRRAIVTTGLSKNDPLAVLVEVNARFCEKMAGFPEVLEASQEYIQGCAANNMEIRLHATIDKLVAKTGGDVAKANKYKWAGFALAVVLSVFGACYELASYTIEKRFIWETRMMEDNYTSLLASANANIPDKISWARTILDEKSVDGSPYPCIGWGDQSSTSTKPGNPHGGYFPVVTCVVALRFK